LLIWVGKVMHKKPSQVPHPALGHKVLCWLLLKLTAPFPQKEEINFFSV